MTRKKNCLDVFNLLVTFTVVLFQQLFLFQIVAKERNDAGKSWNKDGQFSCLCTESLTRLEPCCAALLYVWVTANLEDGHRPEEPSPGVRSCTHCSLKCCGLRLAACGTASKTFWRVPPKTGGGQWSEGGRGGGMWSVSRGSKWTRSLSLQPKMVIRKITREDSPSQTCEVIFSDEALSLSLGVCCLISQMSDAVWLWCHKKAPRFDPTTFYFKTLRANCSLIALPLLLCILFWQIALKILCD